MQQSTKPTPTGTVNLKPIVAVIAFAFMLELSFSSLADEASYLESFKGDWQGKGIVRVKTSFPEVAVDCRFESATTNTSLKLDGICRALVVIMKAVSAELVLNDGQYTGSYIGARTGPAALEGQRVGDAIGLNITWAGEVNGDRSAIMRIAKTNPDQMMLSIIDIDPETGHWVTTSRFELNRN